MGNVAAPGTGRSIIKYKLHWHVVLTHFPVAFFMGSFGFEGLFMTEHKDIQDMIEVLSISIVREEAEEQFYRCSASASTGQVVRDFFLEIADEVGKHRQNLEQRRERLLGALEDLQKAVDKNSGEGL